MKKFIKKLFGIDKIEAEVETAKQLKEKLDSLTQQAFQKAEEATAAAARADEERRVSEAFARMTPKEIANSKKEPYINVLQTHINDQNIRNGFFELDWNDHFVVQLKAEGYYGDSDEEVVDAWFREICKNVASETGVEMDRRGSGYINVQNLGDGRSEIS